METLSFNPLTVSVNDQPCPQRQRSSTLKVSFDYNFRISWYNRNQTYLRCLQVSHWKVSWRESCKQSCKQCCKQSYQESCQSWKESRMLDSRQSLSKSRCKTFFLHVLKPQEKRYNIVSIFFEFSALRRGSTPSLSHFREPYGTASVAPMWFSIVLSLLLKNIFCFH